MPLAPPNATPLGLATPGGGRSEWNGRLVAGAVGAMLLLCAALMLAPLAVSWFTSGETAWLRWSWVLACALSAALGGGLARWGRVPEEDDLRPRDGYVIVTLAWLGCSAVGAIPFAMGGGLSLLDAWFETLSGFTTTGASVIARPEDLGASLLLWRALTQWIGGLGIVVLCVAVLPGLGARGSALVRAEFSEHERRLRPRMRDTARLLWRLYVALTAAEVLLLALGGMPLFEAVCHSFTTLSTGGFSTESTSIAAYQSAYVEWVVVAFMFIGGVNFALLYGLVSRGAWRALATDPEVRAYLAITVVATALVAASIWWSGTALAGGGPVRAAAFNTVSMITCTGYATEDFAAWPGLCHLVLLAVIVIGACSGSTGGAIKVVRVLVAWKVVWRELRSLLQPRAVVPLRLGDRVVDRDLAASATSFVVLYLVCLAVGAAALAATGLDAVSAFSASATCLANAGPGLGAVGPATTYADLHPVAKLACTALMLLGRLEIYSVLVCLAPSTWRRG